MWKSATSQPDRVRHCGCSSCKVRPNPNRVQKVNSRELKILAGDRAYERGVDYYEQGRVIQLTTSDGRTSAIVDGTRPYKVELRETTRALEGGCDCPASEGFDFCKHCVAVGLALEARQAEFERLVAGGPDDRIKAYLNRQPQKSLVNIIVQSLAEQPELRDRLSLAADLAAGRLNARDLKKRITAASPMRNIWEARDVSRYFARFEAVLEGMSAVAAEIPPKVLLSTVLHGISRLDKALERVDDSHGYRWGAEQALRDLHINALSRLDWTAENMAAHLLDLTLADPWDQFSGVIDHYADVMGEEGLAAFYALAQNRLQELPELVFGASFTEQALHLRLSHLLEDKAREDGDLDALIELARRTCTSAHDYNRIAGLYLQKGQTDDAMSWLEKADAIVRPQSRDHDLRVALHRVRGEWSQAIAAQQAIFEARPARAQYDRLMEIACEGGLADEVEVTARAFLQTQLESHPWQAETAAVTLAAVLEADGSASEAFELVRVHVRDPHQLLAHAQEFESEPAWACELIRLAAEGFINRKDKRSYAQAVKVLQAARPLFDRIGPDAFKCCLAEVRDRHAAKRNLMALLEQVRK